MTRRERIYQKYGGKCAYSGTPLESDWQIDHIEPVQRFWDGKIAAKSRDCEDNMVPCQRAINNYKWAYPLEYFRLVLLGKLHFRLRKYPYSGKGGERRKRMEKIAAYFGITPDKPFKGTFYFEEANNANT